MSTNINIVVGSVNLPDQAKLFQSAARNQQLEREEDRRTETKATKKRSDRLKAEGKNPDGSPTFNDTFKRKGPSRDPTADNGPDTPLGYFWLQDTAVTVDNLTYPKIIIASGDGSQTVEATFENPNVFSYLNATRPSIPNDTDWEFEDNVYIAGNLLALTTFYQPLNQPVNARDFRRTIVGPPASFRDTCFQGDLVDLTPPYTAFIKTNYRRIYSVYSRAAVANRYVILPLGKDTALYAYYYAGAARHDYLTIEETTVSTPTSLSEPDASGYRTQVTTVSNSYSQQLTPLNQTEFEECICFIVSKKRAERITTPPALLEQFRALVGTVTNGPVQTNYYQANSPCSAKSNSALFETFVYSNYPTFTNPDTGATLRGYPITYTDLAFSRGDELIYSNENNFCRYSEYGLTLEGESDDSFGGGTPLTWYYLDSAQAAQDIADCVTHEDVRAITSPGIADSVGSKLPYKKYIGLPVNVRTDLRINNIKIYQGRGGAIEGPLEEANYPYPASPWRPGGSVKKAGTPPSILSQLYFIYDWGNVAFCREQADRYGIQQ